jgi:hypothetical protein
VRLPAPHRARALIRAPPPHRLLLLCSSCGELRYRFRVFSFRGYPIAWSDVAGGYTFATFGLARVQTVLTLSLLLVVQLEWVVAELVCLNDPASYSLSDDGRSKLCPNHLLVWGGMYLSVLLFAFVVVNLFNLWCVGCGAAELTRPCSRAGATASRTRSRRCASCR